MKINFYLIVLSILSVICVSAGAQTWQWAGIEGGTGWDSSPRICSDYKGGSFICGSYGSACQLRGQNLPFTTWSAHFIARLNAAGDIIWVKPYSNHKSHSAAMTSDKNGNLYL